MEKHVFPGWMDLKSNVSRTKRVENPALTTACANCPTDTPAPGLNIISPEVCSRFISTFCTKESLRNSISTLREHWEQVNPLMPTSARTICALPDTVANSAAKNKMKKRPFVMTILKSTGKVTLFMAISLPLPSWHMPPKQSTDC